MSSVALIVRTWSMSCWEILSICMWTEKDLSNNFNPTTTIHRDTYSFFFVKNDWIDLTLRHVSASEHPPSSWTWIRVQSPPHHFPWTCVTESRCEESVYTKGEVVAWNDPNSQLGLCQLSWPWLAGHSSPQSSRPWLTASASRSGCLLPTIAACTANSHPVGASSCGWRRRPCSHCWLSCLSSRKPYLPSLPQSAYMRPWENDDRHHYPQTGIEL